MSTGTQERTAEHRPMSAEEYHADPAMSSGKIETFRQSRRLFHAINVAKTMPPKPATPPMQFGTLVHLKLLEPQRFADCVADPYPETAPDGKNWLRRKGSDHERWWQEELDKRTGKIACDQETLDRVDEVAKSVLANWHARRLLERDGIAEYPIFWTDPQTGLECKCLVDWFSTICLDIKTTRDPSPAAFVRQCVDLGYAVKKAHYLAGLQALTDEADPPFVHIAVGTERPFVTCVYELNDFDLDGQSLGRAQRRKAMASLAECYASGIWTEPYERQIVNLRLPGWAFTVDDYTFF